MTPITSDEQALADRLRAKAALSIQHCATHLGSFTVPVYDADMRALLTQAADAITRLAKTGPAVDVGRDFFGIEIIENTYLPPNVVFVGNRKDFDAAITAALEARG